MLKRFGIDTKNLDVEKLRSDYNALYSKKQTLQKTYKSAGVFLFMLSHIPIFFYRNALHLHIKTVD